MRSSRLLAVLALATGTACAEPDAAVARTGAVRSAPAVATDTLAALIPAGTFPVAVMEPRAPARLREILARVQAAGRADPEWWSEHARVAAPGEPVRYDPRMGISEAEYREVLALPGEQRLAKVGEAQLTIRRADRGRYVLDGGSEMPELTGIVIDPERDEVRTPLGTAAASERVRASPEQKATGPWSGVSWTHSDFDSATGSGSSISFNLGRLQESGRDILYYNAKGVADGRLQDRAMRVFTYELPVR